LERPSRPKRSTLSFFPTSASSSASPNSLVRSRVLRLSRLIHQAKMVPAATPTRPTAKTYGHQVGVPPVPPVLINAIKQTPRESTQPSEAQPAVWQAPAFNTDPDVQDRHSVAAGPMQEVQPTEQPPQLDVAAFQYCPLGQTSSHRPFRSTGRVDGQERHCAELFAPVVVEEHVAQSPGQGTHDLETELGR
jgi:hypothetical protein